MTFLSYSIESENGVVLVTTDYQEAISFARDSGLDCRKVFDYYPYEKCDGLKKPMEEV